MSLVQPALTQEPASVLHELDSELSACRSLQEIENVAANAVPRLFRGWSGELRLLDDFYRRVAERPWFPEKGNSFNAADCWALRLGRISITGASDPRPLCRHFLPLAAGTHFCVPLFADFAERVPLGILHVFSRGDLAEASSANDESSAAHEVLAALGRSVAAALASLLSAPTAHSTCPARDDLTGLFSRSYVEASLEREIHRAEAENRPVSVVRFDLDNFDHFRAECGDAAAEILLQAMAQMIQSHIRPKDLACRYQRGEFALVMPEAPAYVARERAEQFRGKIRLIGWCNNATLSAPVTLSAGVAAFPDHASTTLCLFRAAGGALLRAAAAGRDRVVVASPVRTAVA